MSWRTAIGLLLVAMSIGLHVQCSNDEPDGDVSKKARGEASPKTPARVTFENRLEGSGVDFAHVSGARGKRYLIETMGSGVVLFDYDADGDPDLYFVQSGPHPGEGTPVGNRLYRNDGEWQFEDVTGAAGVGDTGYGMGGTAADIDNDGDLDLYVTNFGANVLYRNRGDGTFEDITEAAGVGHTGWGTSCTFLDYDRDGLLDLYVVNYLAMTYETHRDCYFRDLLIYCSPGEYPGQPDVLYRNLGDGKFEDVTAKAGIRSDAESKGLGVIASDLDGDGFVDLYVANDSTPNFLYRNEGDGTFEEIGLRAGVSRDANGRAESGMGVDAADYDGDGDFDLIVTNYQGETNTLYQNDGDWSFLDVTTPTKLTAATFYYLGFGVAWFDADGDGWQDLAFANGHVMDNVAKTDRTAKHAQKNNFLLGAALGQRRVYEDCTARAGEGFETELVSRGLATGDLDGDGDIDLVITNCGGLPELLENRWHTSQKRSDRWIALALEGRGERSNRSAVGARVALTVRDGDGGERTQVREVHAGSSYLSQNELAVHFGWPEGSSLSKIMIRWPDGQEQTLGDLAIGQRHRLVQGD